jgi:D-sedoheptulose 7-phosphate isomerase
MKFIEEYFSNFSNCLSLLDYKILNKIIDKIKTIKKNKGRIFFIGVGGSAANCSHAVNDFRKICNIESYCITDNVSEVTARTNDEGWEAIFEKYLQTSKFNKNDAIFVMSVGGGNKKKQISVNIVKAVIFAKNKKAKIFGIVGRKDGFVFKSSKDVIYVPVNNKNLITPISESVQSIIWHCIVSDPRLAVNKTKW